MLGDGRLCCSLYGKAPDVCLRCLANPVNAADHLQLRVERWLRLEDEDVASRRQRKASSVARGRE